MYLQPVKHKFLALLGAKERDLTDICVKRWELAPEEHQAVPPAIYNRSDLDRVTGTWGDASMAEEIQKLDSGVRHHAPTAAFLLKDVDAIDGYLYSPRRWKSRLLAHTRPPVWRQRPDIRIPHGSLACTLFGNVYFGHWVTDDLTLHLAAERTGDPFIFERGTYPHEPGYRDLLRIPRSALQKAHFDELVVIRDVGQNAYKRKRYHALRGRLAARVDQRGARRIYLRRGSTGESRTLVNAAELEAYLASQDFCVVDPDQLSPAEIAARTQGARIVLGIEGSHMAHALLTMAEGAVMCCIQPPWRFVTIFRDQMDCLDMRYAVVVGHAVAGGFRVDLDDVKRVLEQIDVVQQRLPV